jgi:pyruvate,orthophosphate dikinase
VPGLKVGICGEHGGEPSSVEFCHRVGMTYVSCSPYMVPVAWLAAAQAEIKWPGEVQPKASRANTSKAVTVAARKRRKKR